MTAGKAEYNHGEIKKRIKTTELHGVVLSPWEIAWSFKTIWVLSYLRFLAVKLCVLPSVLSRGFISWYFSKLRITGRQGESLAFFLLFSFLAVPASSLDSILPVIGRLDSRDLVFKQYISEIEAGRRLLFSSRQKAAEELASALTIYSYTPVENENLLGIAARCNIPYATLASLNRYSHLEDLTSGKPMLLPTMPGIFVPEIPTTDLERLVFSARKETAVSLAIPHDGKTERFYFLPGDDFSPTERVFFLNRDFRFPLKNFQVSSAYGMRINPVTGKQSMHGGIDLAAPEGTEVYAAKNGTVTELGEDPVYGKYVIISHDNNMVSLYGHLSSIGTSLNAKVLSGAVIGKVGSTGQSTGPHLHFELRQNGQSRDPAKLLRLFQ